MIEKLAWKPLDEDFVNKINDKAEGNLFMQNLGVKFGVIEPGYLETYLILEERHLQQMNFVHGGVIATVADISMGFAAFTLVSKTQAVVTVDLKINYINPAIGQVLKAKAHVYKTGSKLIFCKTEIFSENNGVVTQVAFSDSIMAIINDI